MVGGSFEDERLFSVMNFVKSATRNCLNVQLAVRMKAQNLFDLHTFPYADTLEAWHVAADAHGCYHSRG